MRSRFANESRCYDAALHAMRFWGHDGARFDQIRERIHATAARV